MKCFKKFICHIASTYTEGGLITGTMWLVVEAILNAFFALIMLYCGVHWAMYALARVFFGKNSSSVFLSEEGRMALHGNRAIQ